jgi:hypothetical protein
MAIAREDVDALGERLVHDGARGGETLPADLLAQLEAVRVIPFATTTQARQPTLLRVDREQSPWVVEQTLVDDEGEGLGVVRFTADLDALDGADVPFLRLESVDA